MDIINGSKNVQSDAPSDSFEAKFGKKMTFRQLYDLLKHHKRYVFNRKIPQWSCLCEIYENAIFLVNGINKKLFPECRLPQTTHELVVKFSCNNTEDRMTGKCEVCSSTKLTCKISIHHQIAIRRQMILVIPTRKVTAMGTSFANTNGLVVTTTSSRKCSSKRALMNPYIC